ncbi:MAG: trimeric intracellular cation channel family protein [Lachnospiraceae bacterium]|nr:trimeric intracellular cation channel family protein [Lachnospiraceae bacterium]
MDTFVFVIELLGTAAFAVTGAVTAMGKRMDILGVIVLGVTTATGGGVIRDLILGRTPPVTFSKPVYAIVAATVSVAVFLPLIQRLILFSKKVYEPFLFIMDTAGLGIFTVIGVAAAYNMYPDAGLFLPVFVGVVTGVGGGVLRDIFAGDTPYIFTKHVYASASIAGAVFYALMHSMLQDSVNYIISMLIVTMIRLLASHYKWNLPRAGGDCQNF